MKQSTLYSIITCLFLTFLGTGTTLAAGQGDQAPGRTKVDICHYQVDNDAWKKQTVGSKAATNHLTNLDHDDAMPGGITSKTGTQLDSDCVPEIVQSCGDCLESNGTPGCTVQACEDAVCASDLFCCEVTWDSICADEAQESCVETGICQGPPPV